MRPWIKQAVLKVKGGLRGLPLRMRYYIARIKDKVTGKTLLEKGTLRTFEIMIHDMEKVDGLYKPSLFWKDIYKHFIRLMYTEGIQNFKVQRYNRCFAGFYPTDPIIYKCLLWSYYNNLKQKDSLNLLNSLEEPEFGGGGDVYLIEDKKITLDLLQSIDEFYRIYSYFDQIKNKNLVVAELGAGYGRLAYIFLKALKNVTYVIVDLPGGLIFSEYYLSNLFPDKKIMSYESSKKYQMFNREIMQEFNIVFLGPWQLQQIASKSIDIFSNIYSFQEMKLEHIQNYFSLIDKKCNGIFYTKQSINIKNQWDGIDANFPYPIKKNWKELYFNKSPLMQHVFEAVYKID